MVLAIVRPGAPPPGGPPSPGPVEDEVGQDVRAVVVALRVVDAPDLVDVLAARAPPSSAAMASVVPTLRAFLLVMITDSFTADSKRITYIRFGPTVPLSGYAAIS
jgi:hypothetical protein